MNDYPQTEPRPRHTHGGHGWMMIACCIPMLLIAVALVAAGVVSTGFVFGAVLCTVMMMLMMRAMAGPGGHHRDQPGR